MRSKGEGTVYQRKDGRWVATMYDQTGKRRELYGATSEQALEHRDAAKRAGLPVGGSLTVGRWLHSWLDGKTRLSARTREGYASKIKNLEPLIGRKRLDKLTAEDIEQAYVALRTDLAEQTVLHCHRVLSSALKTAQKRGRIISNPLASVDSPSPDRYRPTTFTAEDARKVLQEASRRRNGARWWFALLLGLRNGEALGLTWDRIDLQRRTVTISHQLQRHRNQGLVMVPATKSRKDRVLPLPAALCELLDAMPRVSAHAFTIDAMPISPERDRRDWIELLAAAHLPFVRIYDCRHTTATLLMEHGVPARVVADILGHSTTRLTLDTYTHVGDHVMVGALDGLTAALTAEMTADQPTLTNGHDSARTVRAKGSERKRRVSPVS